MKITYLFGAGASKKAIPINETLRDSMDLELQNLKEEFKARPSEIFNQTIFPHLTKSLSDQLIADYSLVMEESKTHQSIDTYAKKLYIKNETEKLKKLKTIMSIYFIIIQSRNNAEERYDSFFASILDEDHNVFPKNLRILTWNYDNQFEKAYSEYSNDPNMNASALNLKVYSKNSGLDYINNEDFGIIKLNGTAAFLFDKEESNRINFIEKVNEKYNIYLLQTILNNYQLLHHNTKTKEKIMTSISFAWENYNNGKFIVNKAIEFTENTEILVVIGYSFPFFNRKVDRDIIRAMKNLKIVYFQAPDAIDLRERFLAIRNDIKQENLLVRTDLKQFVFPNEF